MTYNYFVYIPFYITHQYDACNKDMLQIKTLILLFYNITYKMRYLYYYERYVLTKLAKTCSTTPGNLVHSSPATLLDASGVKPDWSFLQFSPVRIFGPYSKKPILLHIWHQICITLNNFAKKNFLCYFLSDSECSIYLFQKKVNVEKFKEMSDSVNKTKNLSKLFNFDLI